MAPDRPPCGLTSALRASSHPWSWSLHRARFHTLRQPAAGPQHARHLATGRLWLKPAEGFGHDRVDRVVGQRDRLGDHGMTIKAR